jgi:hypothetical protein
LYRAAPTVIREKASGIALITGMALLHVAAAMQASTDCACEG